MAIIKAPPKQPKSVTIQARVEESVKMQLDQYAKFIDSTPSYVITEALRVLFKRDDEFKSWLGQHAERKEFRPESRRGSHEDRIRIMKTRPTQFGERENTASSRRHASRLTVDSLPAMSEVRPRGLQYREPTPVLASHASGPDESITTMQLDAATGGERSDRAETFSFLERLLLPKSRD